MIRMQGGQLRPMIYKGCLITIHKLPFLFVAILCLTIEDYEVQIVFSRRNLLLTDIVKIILFDSCGLQMNGRF